MTEARFQVDRHEAQNSLRDIAAAQDRSRSHFFYRTASPQVITWGIVWLIANTVSYLAPDLRSEVWMAGILLGTIASVYFGVRAGASDQPVQRPTWKVIAGGFALAVIIIAGLTAIGMIGGFEGPRQANAMISLVVAIFYAAGGLQGGLRLTALGIFVGVAAVVGYLFLGPHYELWMGLVGGGSLILGGLWMRQG